MCPVNRTKVPLHWRGRLMTADAASGGATVNLERGASGRMSALSTVYSGSTISSTSYGYESVTGRLTNVTPTGSGHGVSYGYIPNSDLLQTTSVMESGVTRVSAFRVVDGLGRLRSLTQYKGSGALVASDTYDHDSRHRRTKSTRNGVDSWNYGYNTRNEVTSGVKKDSGGTALPG